jgi:biotin transport system substrate-specific component
MRLSWPAGEIPLTHPAFPGSLTFNRLESLPPETGGPFGAFPEQTAADGFSPNTGVIMDNSASIIGKRKAIAGTTLTALFAALIAAGTFISIPLPFSPVPIVLQNFFALISGLILGPFLGGIAAGLFLLAGAIGAPVFAGATGGFVHFLKPSGGFLFGYLLSAVCAGLIAGRPRAGAKSPLWRIVLGAVAGALIVYVPGLIRLKYAINGTWVQTFAMGFLPFVIGDAAKTVAAVIISPRLRALVADQIDG